MSVRAPLVVMVFAKTKSTLMYVNVLLDTLGYVVTYVRIDMISTFFLNNNKF